MDESCSDETMPGCTSCTVNEEQQGDNMTPLLAAGSSIICDTLNATVSESTQEKLDENYCVEATKLILDLGKYFNFFVGVLCDCAMRCCK